MATKTAPRAKRREIKNNEIESELLHNYEKFDFRFKKREFKFTEKQSRLIEIVNDPSTKVILIEGPAGTSKSLMGVYCGLTQLKDKRVDNIMYLRSVVESAQKSMGYLPGDASLKLSFFTAIIDDKLLELVEPQDIPGFHLCKKIETMPINYIRGCSWRRTFVLGDEFQNCSVKEILSTLTRIGEGSVMAICGDFRQCDIGNSGFQKVFNLFDNEESKKQGIHTFRFTEDDIVRSEIVKFIVKKFNTLM
jgi:phosphate starvation-inducible PhoH-like protein